MNSPRVLVVEDDHGLRDVLSRGLRAEEFDVLTAADGAAALSAADASIQAIVLDIGLPDSDGRDVCQALRARGIDAPVLFLTARGNNVDLLAGFAAGGDDYLTKPFQFSELVARLRAVLRRRPLHPVGDSDLQVDPLAHRLVHGDRAVRLAPTEYKLLACLLATRGTVVRRRELREAAWPAGAIVAENTIDQYVAKLRRRLAEVGSDAAIDVVRGVGYELR